MRLRIHLTAHWQDVASNCNWVLLDDAGAQRDAGTSPLAAMPHADEAIAIVASDRVLTTAAELPRLKRNKLETALPFLLEDRLLDDASTVHVTPGKKLADGRTVLYALDKEWLSRFLAACASAKLRLRSVVPEFCLLPQRGDEWSVAWDGTQGFMAMNGQMGCALDQGGNSRMPALLQLHLHRAPPSALRLFTLGNEMATPDWDSRVPLLFEQQLFDWRKAAIPSDTPNLLWGKFAPPPRIGELWLVLRPALMVLLLLFCVEAALSNIEWAVLAHEKRQLSNAMTDTFRESFGSDAVVVDAPLQMRRNLAHLRHAAGVSDEADFLPLLERFSAATDDLPGRLLNTVRYENGKLDVEMQLSGAHAIDDLRRRMAEAGLSTQLMDTRTAGSTMTVQMRISAGGV
jgi:general secretion pathway protein L